jgi:hypothetical protein
MILTASDVSSLARSLGRWEWAEYSSCALVALGCSGEYIAEFTDLWSGGVKEKKDRLAKRSTLLLISALALELMCLVKTNSISGTLIGSLSDEAQKADVKAQSALDKSNTADTKAGEALSKSMAATDAAGKAHEKVAATAKRAEEIDADLALTQYLMSARSITDLDSMVGGLKQYKGQRLIVDSYANDAEITGLCSALGYAAHKAEMDVTQECGNKWTMGGTSTGVVISGPDVQETMDIARLLLKTANLGPGGAVSAIKAPVLTIFVGARPPFMTGQARGVKAPTVKKNAKHQPK